MSVTSSIQSGTITFNNQEYAVVDTPGFFDTSNSELENVDSINMCKLVATLESCSQIAALVFVFTDGFSTPHKIWFDRMTQLISPANRGQILLLKNKESQISLEELAENKAEVNQMLGGSVKQPYFSFQFSAPSENVEYLLTTISQMIPFELKNLTVPEICYKQTEEDPEYEELINTATNNEGQMVEEVKDTSHYEQRRRGGVAGALGGKKSVWVRSSAIEKKFVDRWVTTRTFATYINVYKVRFDGTRDLAEKREIESKRRFEVI
ncbi:hypothetical protein HA402_015178 [Bradysia odoriphaga]|nr:hypothetical protein HA402_015178 [Bradysia odoriphaga]